MGLRLSIISLAGRSVSYRNLEAFAFLVLPWADEINTEFGSDMLFFHFGPGIKWPWPSVPCQVRWEAAAFFVNSLRLHLLLVSVSSGLYQFRMEMRKNKEASIAYEMYKQRGFWDSLSSGQCVSDGHLWVLILSSKQLQVSAYWFIQWLKGTWKTFLAVRF